MANHATHIAVDNLTPQQRVKIEMIRRGWKTGTLAKKIGYKTDSLTNLLCGNMTSHAAQCRIEDVLGMPFWSSEEEFATRQAHKPTKQKS